MGITRVQAFSGTNTGFASVVTTSAVTTTLGNMLVAIAQADTVAQNGITVTDSKTNSWTRVKSVSLAAVFDLEVWVTVLTAAGASHTVTATDNGGGVDSLIIVEEWSGEAASPSDVSAGTSGSSTALNSGATGTTAQANEMVMCAGVSSGNVTMTAAGSFSNLTKVNTTFSTLAFESQIVSAAAAQTGVMTSGTANSWVCIVATFKELAAAGGSATGNFLAFM